MKRTLALWLDIPILLVAAASANAQASAKKIALIGILELGTPAASASQFEALQQGLRELGYVAGKNIRLDYRYANGKLERLPELAAELVRAKVDVIVTRSTGSIRAAMKATTTIPIVFASAGAPVEDRLVANLGKPGGNVTGLTQLSAELDGKKLEILKQSAPKVTEVGLLWTSGSARPDSRSQEAEPAAKALGIHLHSLELKDSDDFPRIFDLAKQLGVHAMSFAPSPLLFTHRITIFGFLSKNRLPAMYSTKDFVEAGGLMSYGQDLLDNWRRSAIFVDKILKGAKPGDLPVEQAKKFELVINLKAAKQIGLKIPQSVLYRADRVMK